MRTVMEGPRHMTSSTDSIARRPMTIAEARAPVLAELAAAGAELSRLIAQQGALDTARHRSLRRQIIMWGGLNAVVILAATLSPWLHAHP